MNIPMRPPKPFHPLVPLFIVVCSVCGAINASRVSAAYLFHTQPLISLGIGLLVPAVAVLSWYWYGNLLSKYFKIEASAMRALDAWSYAPLLFLLAAYLPVDLPQNWNHTEGKVRTLWALAFFLIFQIKGWTFIRLVANYGLRRPCITAFLLFFAVFAGYSAFQTHRLLVGDEIGYHDTMQSIIRDGDIDIANNMEPSTVFMHGYLFGNPFTVDIESDSGKLLYNHYFYHNGTTYRNAAGWHMFFPAMPLGPAFSAIPYAIAGKPGIMAFRIACGALLFALLLLICLRLGLQPAHALAALFIIAYIPHVIIWINSYLVETFGSLLLVMGILLYLQPSFRLKAASVVPFALLPWVHIRFCVFIPAVIIAMAVEKTVAWRKKAVLILAVGLLSLTIIPFNLHNARNILPWGFRPPWNESDFLNMQDLRVYDEDSINGHFSTGINPLGKNTVRGSFVKSAINALIGRDAGLWVYYPLLLPAVMAMARFPAIIAIPVYLYMLFIVFTPFPLYFLRYFTVVMPLLGIGVAAMLRFRNSIYFSLSLACTAALAAYRFTFQDFPDDGFLRSLPVGLSEGPGISGAESAILLAWLMIIAVHILKERTRFTQPDTVFRKVIRYL